MQKLLLDIDNIAVTYYGGYSGVSSAKLVIPEFSLVCLVGSRESGKSSLLKALGGLESYSGSIIYKGKELNKIAIKDRNFALTFSEDSLRRKDSVEKCLAYPMKIRKQFTRDQIRERVADVAAEWGLSGCLNARIGQLNNVSKSTVILARAFLLKRDLYMLDNPLINIYGSERAELLKILSKSLRNVKSTVIFATDNIAEAMALSPDIYAVIENGILADSGSIREIYRDPSSIAVATQVAGGEINNIAIPIERGIISLQGKSIDLSRRIIDTNFNNVQLVIYPSDIRLSKSGQFNGIIIAKTDYIVTSKLTVKFVDDIITIVCDYNALDGVGDLIHFDIDKDKMYIFDSMSELSIIK